MIMMMTMMMEKKVKNEDGDDEEDEDEDDDESGERGSERGRERGRQREEREGKKRGVDGEAKHRGPQTLARTSFINGCLCRGTSRRFQGVCRFQHPQKTCPTVGRVERDQKKNACT